ncbi:hypothetical protein HWD94_03990 [Pseudarthrobacter equi]|uniref:hypothetical protein n=1 Tax=Pseudarthrobacter equi TaxID=728066 RepID=UPI0021BFAD78|nr:hypothetical protein [Pseudarthrobacter equi]MCT9624284.1 hypothetical protein [Pseudarthrobacter equi]
MTTQTIDFSRFNAPDDRVLAFLNANGLDPNTIPAQSTATIEDGNLTVSEFIFEQTVPGAPPHKTLNDDGTGCKKTTRTVPLVSAPEQHGIVGA